MTFTLDTRLKNDSQLVGNLNQCQVRLMEDCRWPWLILVPEIGETAELFDLDTDRYNLVMQEVYRTSHAVKEVTNCTKINIGALGNIVRQLHIHIIARSEGDVNWPGPVWGFESRIPYSDEKRDAIILKISNQLF